MKEVIATRYADVTRIPVAFDGRKMFASDKIEIIHVLLKPGEFIEKHPNPVDVVFYILAGNGMLTAEEKLYVGEPFMSVFVPAGMPREWRNTGSEDLRILVIKMLS